MDFACDAAGLQVQPPCIYIFCAFLDEKHVGIPFDYSIRTDNISRFGQG